jgi:hypothetical protein
MVLFKKIAVVLFLMAMGLVGFGKLPKHISDRITRFLAAVLIVGFAVRVGAYLLAQQ